MVGLIISHHFLFQGTGKRGSEVYAVNLLLLRSEGLELQLVNKVVVVSTLVLFKVLLKGFGRQFIDQ